MVRRHVPAPLTFTDRRACVAVDLQQHPARDRTGLTATILQSFATTNRPLPRAIVLTTGRMTSSKLTSRNFAQRAERLSLLRAISSVVSCDKFSRRLPREN